MSHIVKLELQINDLEALSEACKKLGCELVKNQKSFKWFGRWVGDYPMPEGMNVEDFGKCDHAIRVKGNNEAYEIGVVKNKTGKGFFLAYDFWQGGYGLETKVGKNCGLLKQEYTVQAIISKIKTRREVRKMDEVTENNKRKITIHLK